MTFESRGVARSSDNIKILNLNCRNANGHLIWQEGDLPWEAPLIKLHDPLITLPCGITQQIKTLNFHYHNV